MNDVPILTEEEAILSLTNAAADTYSFTETASTDIVLHIFAKLWKMDCKGMPFSYFHASSGGLYTIIAVQIDIEPGTYLILTRDVKKNSCYFLETPDLQNFIDPEDPVGYYFMVSGTDKGTVYFRTGEKRFVFPGVSIRERMLLKLEIRILSLLDSILN